MMSASKSHLILALTTGLLCLPPAGAEIVHRWSFNNPAGAAPNGTTMPDTISGAVATVVGEWQGTASFDGAALRLTGVHHGNHSLGFMPPYVDLPDGIISSKTSLSVEIWATPHAVNNYDRLFDFGSSNITHGPGADPGEIIDINGQGATPGATASVDTLYWSFGVGNDEDQQRLASEIEGSTSTPELSHDVDAATTLGARYHYVFIFEDGVGTYGATGGRVSWYRDGGLLYTADVDFRLAEINDVNNWLGRSQWTQDWNSNASYDECRIYDHALTPAEIAANLAAGPDTLVDPPDPVDPPVPDSLWTFTAQADSTADPGLAFVDEIGGTHELILRGQGGALDGRQVVLPGTTTGNQPESSISAYLDLPNGIISESANLTIEAWATPISSRLWQRLFDFGRCVGTHGSGAAPGEVIDGPIAPGATSAWDNLSLTLNNAGDFDTHQLEGEYDDNGPVFTTSTRTTVPGHEYHYVLVVEDGVGEFGAGGCRVSWYRDGILQNADDFNFRLVDMEDVNNWIGRSMYANDSNSNLSLNELRLYRRAITPAEIFASRAAGPDPSSGPPEPPTPAPIPVRRWDFNTPAGSAAAGAVFLDATTGDPVTVRGNGATLDGTSLLMGDAVAPTNGTQNAANISAYLEMENGFISSFDEITVEAWITPLSSRNWQRVFDFGNCTVTHGDGALPGEIIDGDTAPAGFQSNDNLFLSLNNGGALGSHRLGGKIDGGGETRVDIDLSGSTSAGTEYHFVMTVEDRGAAGSRVRWYRDGLVQASLDLGFRLRDLDDVNNWIGRSNWSTDMNAHLAINELRVYDRAVTPQEVASSRDAGADATFDPPVAVDDAVEMHSGQKALIDLVANDTGGAIANTVVVVTAPAHGSVSVRPGGKVLYEHAGDGSSADSFTYTVSGTGGTSAPATVSVAISGTLRISNPALAMPTAPPETSWQLVDALPGLVFDEPLCLSSPPGDVQRLFVCERMARVMHVPDVTAEAPTTNVFLDLNQVIAGRSPVETIEGGGNNEHGLLGLAFHPDYESNGYFFVAYTVRIAGGSYYQRISRFEVDATDPNIADPASEVIFLEQLDQGSNHDGGDLHFGPDGYLYYSAGDEENPRDFRLNSQFIDKDFFCGVFRIDVDKLPGNLEPNPHPAIPTDGGGQAYFSVPIDNPFVHTSLGGDWDGTYNGEAVALLGNVRTEFWATGLRHTWRMSFDSLTGELWGGDVGQDIYEGINRIERGGNYGWVFREGAHDTGFRTPVPAGFSSIDPVYEYVHGSIAGGDASLKGNSVVGGYVYRGDRFPSLYGSYIFSDSVSGHVWQMDTATGQTERITGMPGAYGVISAQGVDPSNGDLLFCAYLDGRIMRLTRGGDLSDGFPQTLSATGLFSDLSDLSPAPGLLSVTPNLKFWSDHADKTRWFAIPNESSRMFWRREGNWDYPTGMLWVKHFDLSMSRDDPATHKRLETRVLVKTDDGVYGVSYRWNEEETEAYLVEEPGVGFDLAIDDHGTPHTQHWEIPGRANCLTCHDSSPLSFNTRQLNREVVMNGFAGNQIELLAAHGFLDNTPEPAATLPYHVTPGDSAQPLERRVRSYLDVNCAYCHQDGGTVSGFWDGREVLTLEGTGLIHGLPVNGGGDPLNRYIVPGEIDHSVLLSRVAETNGFTRMPPLATSELDQEGIDLLTAWIQSELPNRVLYDEWAADHGVIGGSEDDDDGDGRSNRDEYVLGTDPGSGSDAAPLVLDSGVLRFTRQPFRSYEILTSDNLVDWSRWEVSQNPAGYDTSASDVGIPFVPSAADPARFFRLEVSEP